MSIDNTLQQWYSKKRRMGCVAATNWFCKRHKEFRPHRISRFDSDGYEYQHVVASNGRIFIDLAPYTYDPTAKAVINE